MDEKEKAKLVKYYEGLNDEALLAKHSEGKESFTEDAYGIILEEVEKRKKADLLFGVPYIVEKQPSLSLSGVDGWLKIFVFLGLILNPIRIGILWMAPSDLSGFDLFNKILWTPFACWQVYVAYRLAKIKPKSVRDAKIFLLAHFVCSLVVACFNWHAGGYFQVGGLLASLAWFLYFNYSKRVQITYPDEFVANGTSDVIAASLNTVDEPAKNEPKSVPFVNSIKAEDSTQLSNQHPEKVEFMNRNQKIVTALACMVMVLAVITTPKVHYARGSKFQVEAGQRPGTTDPVALAQRAICVLSGWGALFILAGLWKSGKKQ